MQLDTLHNDFWSILDLKPVLPFLVQVAGDAFCGSRVLSSVLSTHFYTLWSITRKGLRIPMEHIESKDSTISKLQIDTICPVEILDTFEVITK